MTIDKRDFIFAALFFILLGVGMGYAWRMIQVEPRIAYEISLNQREIDILEEENRVLGRKLGALEARLAIINKARKKGK